MASASSGLAVHSRIFLALICLVVDMMHVSARWCWCWCVNLCSGGFTKIPSPLTMHASIRTSHKRKLIRVKRTNTYAHRTSGHTIRLKRTNTCGGSHGACPPARAAAATRSTAGRASCGVLLLSLIGWVSVSQPSCTVHTHRMLSHDYLKAHALPLLELLPRVDELPGVRPAHNMQKRSGVERSIVVRRLSNAHNSTHNQAGPPAPNHPPTNPSKPFTQWRLTRAAAGSPAPSPPPPPASRTWMIMMMCLGGSSDRER